MSESDSFSHGGQGGPFSRRRTGLLLAGLVLGMAAAQNARADLLLNTPIVAHRGYSYVAPENTLAAVQAAIDIGASGVEFDVWQCASGELVVKHGSSFSGTNGSGGNIMTRDWNYIKTLTVTITPPDPIDYPPQGIPLMSQVMTLLKGTGTKAVCEIKDNRTSLPPLVASQITAMDMVDETVVISFVAASLAAVKTANPNIATGLLMFDHYVWGGDVRNPSETTADLADRICGLLATASADVPDIEFNALTPELVTELKNRGVNCWAFTPDSQTQMQALLDMGVVSITTNRPDLGLEIVPEPNSLALLAGLTLLFLGCVRRRRTLSQPGSRPNRNPKR